MIDDDSVGFVQIIGEMYELPIILRLQQRLENSIDRNGLSPVLRVEKNHGTEGTERSVVVLRAVLKYLLDSASAPGGEQNPFVRDLQKSLFPKRVLKVLRQMTGDGSRWFMAIVPGGDGQRHTFATQLLLDLEGRSKPSAFGFQCVGMEVSFFIDQWMIGVWEFRELFQQME